MGEALVSHVSRTAEKLRGQDGICSAIHVFIHTNPFREQDPQYSNSIVIPLPNASADTRLLARAALFGLKKIFKPGYAYKKAGVMLMEISDAQTAQGSLLLEHGKGQRSEGLMKAMDALNRRYGRNAVSVFTSSSPKPGPCAGRICRPATLPDGAMCRWRIHADSQKQAIVCLSSNGVDPSIILVSLTG